MCIRDRLTVGMFVALDFVWDRAKADRTEEKAIFIDECWQLLSGAGAAGVRLSLIHIFKKFLFAAFTVAILSCLFCQPAFAAISESDVQAQVDLSLIHICVLHEDDPHFSELFEALKNASAWRKDFFATLKEGRSIRSGLLCLLAEKHTYHLIQCSRRIVHILSLIHI